jgi:threonine dehydrogenase-like Zn-dependent dehydrogenase
MEKYYTFLCETYNGDKLEICPKLDLSQELDIKCILDVVGKFRINQHYKTDTPMTAAVNKYGHLFINGIHAGQITNKIPFGNFDEEGYRYEGKILARSEVE